MQLSLTVSVVVCALLAHHGSNGATGDVYSIGTGRYDITGPAVEINLMGYAKSDQVGSGIHFRQYSRAFIAADSSNRRVVFISADIGMGTQIVKIEVVKKLQSLYGSTYTDDNVLISGTHTHSGPAGFFQYTLYEITSLGFVPQTFEAIVDGIVESVKRAHSNMRAGHLYINTGDLLDASINRSPTAYLNNPASERALYEHDTDKEMTVLKFVDTSGKEWGVIDWFAVHCTSMNNTNTLISGDNKGYASYLMEKDKNNGALPGQGDFVAAFAQANEGDTSPNTRGARCIDTGLPCDNIQSTCNGKVQNCIASGPGKDMFDSTRIIGEKQYTMGKSLYESATTGLTGSVGYSHTHVDFSGISLTVNGQQVRTCPPALGFSFAAGTTDGPGSFNFVQGDTSGNPFWALVRDIIAQPTQEQTDCHSPKPILLNTADLNFPYPWQPRILPVQLLQVGQLIIAGVPSEFTTMSGRRLKNAIRSTLLNNGFSSDVHVVIAGLSNTYSGYVTTYEEYQIQRYEGASTVYGPYTLDAYLQEFEKLASALATGSTVDSGPAFPNYLDQQVSLQTGVIFDSVPFFRSFGQVTENVGSRYGVGDTVTVEFWAGNPRNNLMTEDTFLTVERKNNNRWTVVYTDASWETTFSWVRTSTLLGQSRATVTWTIPSDVVPGTYRIRHFGHYKDFNFFTSSEIVPYSGTSNEFQVTA